MISGRYTDDTEMMMGVAESLIENKGFNGEDMALRFTENYDPSRGYGPGSKEALRRITEGESRINRAISRILTCLVKKGLLYRRSPSP
jgi:ADP-ribosylglycohydrolase